jgi:hypothetical protein
VGFDVPLRRILEHCGGWALLRCFFCKFVFGRTVLDIPGAV